MTDAGQSASAFARIQRAIAARPPALAERDEPYKEAAVALVLRAAADAADLEVLLIRRAMREGDPWSGQIGLPGGRLEARDASLEATALRETREELGLDLEVHGEVFGALDELRPRTPVLPPIIVRPYVCRVRTLPELVPNHEVAAYRWVRLGAIFHPSARVRTTVRVRDIHMSVEAFEIDDFTVWGMTERILTTFAEVWR
jgi:8-oxo-dGTP pyrophosphatase MutT (NUDIX family)